MTRGRKGMIGVSNRDCIRLATDWGFEVERQNGGHVILRYDRAHVHFIAPGRKMPTPWSAIRQAASILGITTKQFLAGPTVANENVAADTGGS